MKPLALRPFHEKRGAQFGELAGCEVVQRYGDLEREYSAARSRVAFLDLSHRDVLRINGQDHISFLQGMLTQEVRSLPDDASTYTALCTAKGAMVADARVVKRAGEIFLEAEPGLGLKIKSSLEKFAISEDVEIADASSDWAILGLRGPSLAGLLQSALGIGPPDKGRLQTARVAGREVMLVEHSWPGWSGVDIWVRRPEAPAICSFFFEESKGGAGIEPIGMDAAEIIRIEAGVPRFGRDMTEATIPLEANLEQAISYTKGCYLGQEVIARATYRGHVNKKLTGVILDDAIQGAAELNCNDRLIGHLTSSAFSWKTGKFVGLAFVHRDYLAPGTRLDVGSRKGAATVHSLPFVASEG